MTADLHTLTGVYAIDAASGDEVADFERHLGECGPCAHEVRELRATAARLGASVPVEPPPDLKALVLAQVARTRQQVPRPAVRRWPALVALLGAAAAVVTAVFFGVSAGHRVDVRQEAIDAVLTAPDASTVHDRGTTVVVSHGQDRIVVLAADLPALDAAHVYQLWLIGPAGPRSAGLLQAGAANRMRPVLTDLPAGTDRVGITVEPAGGSAAPTTPTVSLISLV